MVFLFILAVFFGATVAWRRTKSLPLVMPVAVGVLALVHFTGWLVHPLAALALGWFASVVFSRRRELPLLASATVMIVALSQLGADWVVHPAGGIVLGMLASVIFHRWRRELPLIALGVGLLALFSVLGAEWLIHPAGALALAWLAKTLFSGELFGARPREVPERERAGQPASLPEDTGGATFERGSLFTRPAEPELVTAQGGRRARRRQKQDDGLREVPVAPAPPPNSAAPELALLLQTEAGRLPQEAVARGRELLTSIEEATAYLRERGLQDAEPGLLVRQIASDYAPGAVHAYLRLPRSLADVTPLRDGQTGRDLLLGQLGMLLEATRQAMTDAAVASAQDILTHQRFLEDRFAVKKDFEL